MPFHGRAYAVVSIILVLSLLAVYASIGATLSLLYHPDGRQGLVRNDNTTAKLQDCVHRTSGINTIPSTAPRFRNTILGSVQMDTHSNFRLDTRAGGCQCSDIDSKWRSYIPPGKELE